MISKEILNRFFSKYKYDNQIFQDLMPFRVREILLVATIYNAYILEQEDLLTEKLFGEYSQLNLSNAPRITSVTCSEDAIAKIQESDYQMIILTMQIEQSNPFELSRKIKAIRPNIPILLLFNQNSDLLCLNQEDKLRTIDGVFVWNSDPKIFVAMTKYIEDKYNVDHDTQIGMVRVVLLIEDSIRYYSRYLPILYGQIIEQIKNLISQEYDDTQKLLRMRARPKVLLARTYEEAVVLFNRYKNYLLCVISDVCFPKEGKQDEEAGYKFIRHIQSETLDMPALLQSFESGTASKAQELKAHFINKSSETLAQDIQRFIVKNLGFGDFDFRDHNGDLIMSARNLKEFEGCLNRVPEDSLIYHASRNHFSAWLMARGEIQIAKKVRVRTVKDFPITEDLRQYLIGVCKEVYYHNTRGRVMSYDSNLLKRSGPIIKLAEGALGGKGRGIAFLNMLLHNMDMKNIVEDIDIKIPQTVIIGTLEFESFLNRNGLVNILQKTQDYKEIQRRFLRGNLSNDLMKKLTTYLQQFTSPLAVRSSGLFEDSISQPFSGIYDTFLLPNNHPDFYVRLLQLSDAIKLIFACMYSPSAQAYFESIQYSLEEEKMAIVVQEVVGQQIKDRFYPHISGVAQSYNYYPYSSLEPEDGITAIALGLGQYVVEGAKSYIFCPRRPNMDIYSAQELLKNSQTSFYALDMSKQQIQLIDGEDATLKKFSLNQAEEDGTLEHLASVWDIENQRTRPGLHTIGPRILNFEYILKYDYFPLAKILQNLLEIISMAMGTPVEMEFAVDLSRKENKKDTFYLLQIKHLLQSSQEDQNKSYNLDFSNLLISSRHSIGNKNIENIYDMVYVPPEKFDRALTQEMAQEVGQLNSELRKENRKYILLGHGRWGSKDRWLGIPVRWEQICNSQVIIEYGLPNFQVDASMGSHFFHNMTSSSIAYFYIPFGEKDSFVDWEWLKKQQVINATEHFYHIRLEKPLTVIMDGRKRTGAILKNNTVEEK